MANLTSGDIWHLLYYWHGILNLLQDLLTRSL